MFILLVDDDPDDCELFREAVKEVSPKVRCLTADNGDHAIQMLTQDLVVLPDIIFLDINMPFMDGKHCLTLLRQNVKLINIPVVMYSTTINSEDREKFKNLQADFLVKPSSYIQLVKELSSILNQHRSLSSLAN